MKKSGRITRKKSAAERGSLKSVRRDVERIQEQLSLLRIHDQIADLFVRVAALEAERR